MTVELHTWNSPNGRKMSVALEEMGLPYKVIPVNITKGEQMAPAFLAISPNNKIPAIIDPEGPAGKPVSVFESGAILLYLGEKTGKFLPKPLAERIPVYECLMWQVESCGPMPGQNPRLITGIVSSAIGTAWPSSTVPISQRWIKSQAGRSPRNSAIEPAPRAIMALTETLITIWIDPSASACVSTLPAVGSMNCGNSAR